MKKFSEIEYVRPDMEAEQEKVRAYTKALKEAKSYEELRGLFMEEKTREDAWATMAEVAQVRYTVDTRDSFYEGEVQFWNETIPAIHLFIQISPCRHRLFPHLAVRTLHRLQQSIKITRFALKFRRSIRRNFTVLLRQIRLFDQILHDTVVR